MVALKRKPNQRNNNNNSKNKNKNKNYRKPLNTTNTRRNNNNDNNCKNGSDAADGASSQVGRVYTPSSSASNTEVVSLRNKIRRQKLAGREYFENKKQRAKLRNIRKLKKQRGEEVEVQEPRTIEKLRRFDETIVEDDDAEVRGEDDVDEFSDYFKGLRTPKIMVTTCRRISSTTLDFLKEFRLIVPNMFYYERGAYRIQSITKYAIKKDFTDLIILNETHKRPSGMYICHLPEGPTSYYKLTSLKLAQDMRGSAYLTDHMPEVILNNFATRLGHRIGRQIASLFPQNPEFKGRRVITFHNQRDFIFFRHHRYIFRNGEKCSLQEIGPRFTLKLRSLQEGTFDTKGGRFEFLWRADLQVDRKQMFV